jgi:hypothetical protein
LREGSCALNPIEKAPRNPLQCHSSEWRSAFPPQVKKQSTITGSYAECNDLIEQFKQNKLPLTSGCDMEGSLEAQVTGVLNNIRETASKVPPCLHRQKLQPKDSEFRGLLPHQVPMLLTLPREALFVTSYLCS